MRHPSSWARPWAGRLEGSAIGWCLDWTLSPGAFAMVGMAAVLAGAVHAPLTAILLLFEMTNDYRIILPLMFAVIISLLVSERLQNESVYTLALLRHGIRLDRGRDVEVMEGLRVGEVMSPSRQALRASDSLAEALGRFNKTHTTATASRLKTSLAS